MILLTVVEKLSIQRMNTSQMVEMVSCCYVMVVHTSKYIISNVKLVHRMIDDHY